MTGPDSKAADKAFPNFARKAPGATEKGERQ